MEQARAKLAQERERREYKGVDERLAYAAEHFDDLMSPAPGGSLAVLAGNDRTYIYRLGYEAGPLAFVGERFYVKPLLKNFQFGSHYFLLGLSADRFAFVHGDFGSLERVELPRDVLDAFSEEFPLVYDGHEGALDYSSLENHMPPYHGWKSRNDVRKEEAGKFFQYVNKAVTDYLVAGTDLPVILVSLPEHQSAFRRISTIPHLLDEGIEKDIGGIEAPELLSDAKAVIEHVREARATELLEKFGDAEAHGGASSDLKPSGSLSWSARCAPCSWPKAPTSPAASTSRRARSSCSSESRTAASRAPSWPTASSARPLPRTPTCSSFPPRRFPATPASPRCTGTRRFVTISTDPLR